MLLNLKPSANDTITAGLLWCKYLANFLRIMTVKRYPLTNELATLDAILLPNNGIT